MSADTRCTGSRDRQAFGRGVLLALGLALAAACRSAEHAPAGPALPFHVALMPIAIQDTSVPDASLNTDVFREPSPGEPDDDMRLALSTDSLSRTLARELEPAFVRTTLLARPDDEAAFATLSPAERDAWWQARAREVGANLLVRTRLGVDPAIHGERNEKFWLNLPLFLLGGPMCYFVGDRSYDVSARLQAEFFEVTEEHDALADFSLFAMPLYAQFEGTDLNFLKRSSGFGAYALSLLVPSGLLSAETAEVEDAIGERLGELLGHALAREVHEQRRQFEQNLALGAFRLESERVRFVPDADGRVHVELPLVELAAGTALYRAEVFADSTLLARHDFPARSEDAQRTLLRASFAPSPEVRYLRLHVRDDNAGLRGYTLRVPDEANR